MELIYSMRRKSLKCEPPQLDSDSEVVKPICTISIANIIAFSSTTNLSDSDGDSWGGHVYVCDLDTPWDSHHVTSSQSPITALEWDCEGKHLLVATSVGDVSVFGQRDYLLNDWTCLYTAKFPGEFISKAILFHNGRRIVCIDKKVDAAATEKLQIPRYTPTLRGFGGIACEGACVVTSTGLLCALVPPVAAPPEPAAGSSRAPPPTPLPPEALTVTESLRATRDHIIAASIAHKNGNLLIATVCASPAIYNISGSGRCVRCHLGIVRRSTTPAHAPQLAVQPLPSLYVTDDPVLPPCISWCIHEDGDCLLVGGAVLSLWKLTERSHHIHKLLAKGPVPGNTASGGVQKPSDCFNTLAWQQMAIWSWETVSGGGGSGNAVCVSAPRPSPPRALVATSRGVHLLYRDKLTHICSKQVVAGGADILPVGTAPPKKAKYGTVITNGASATLCCVEASWNGGVAVVLDTHSQLHVYKVVQPCPDIPSPLYVQHFANCLEFALVAGYDYLDLLLTLKPAAREPLYDRMTEWLGRQPVGFRQFYQSAWLNLRAALCRLMPNGQTRASELTSLQTLHSIWACVEAAVRPTELGEKGPLEALQALLEDQPAAHVDLDKILVSLDAKELSCEPGTVCALRRVLERAADIALSLLAALPQHNLALPSAQLHHHGYELWSDPQALNLLRKILAVARVWCVGAGAGAGGAGGARGLHSRIPDSLDVLPLLYRPLTRLLTGKPADVMEEVCTLITQTGGAPRVWESLPRCSVSAPHGKPWPLYLEYLIEPEGLKYSPERLTPPTEPPVPQPALDSIRYMYLGGGCRVARWRQCGRCGALALPAAHCARHPAQRAHDARFLASCRCGGKWTLCSNISSN